MKKEKIVLSIIAISVGVIVLAGIFYLYQSSKRIQPGEIKNITINEPSPTPSSGLFLTVDTPIDEQVVAEKTIRISGKTVPDAKIVILTATDEEAAVPAADGSFSTDINLDRDENIIEISVIAPNGESAKVRRVVFYSTESF